MDVQVDVWLRGQDFATTRPIPGVLREPRAWIDDDVRTVLQGMLRVMHALKHPDDGDREVALRGLSWIVNPYEDGGVVIAIEITMGAAIAGPFDIDKSALETMIARVLQRPVPPPLASERVH
jgi:hypothetical protein